MSSNNNLPIPEPAVSDAKSSEMLRAWVASSGLHCALNVEAWDDPGNWGILLAAVARHVANATLESKGQNADDTIARIHQLFDAELDAPTDNPSGSFQ